MGLLVVNDHLLKGAGVLPGWLTGKLSDVAGLFFAPLLLAELSLILVPARDEHWARKRVLWSGALVGAAFSAVKLSMWASAVYLAAVRVIAEPLGWKVANAVDPTDLVALPALALAVLYGRSWVRAEPGRRHLASSRCNSATRLSGAPNLKR